MRQVKSISQRKSRHNIQGESSKRDFPGCEHFQSCLCSSDVWPWKISDITRKRYIVKVEEGAQSGNRIEVVEQ